MRVVTAAPAATQADQTFDLLLADVLSCRLAPGEKLRITDIAARLKVSVGSVREALSRLAGEGWVTAEAQKGYTVTPVSTDELRDLTTTRVTIEQLCLQEAIRCGDVEWETRIVASFHRLHRIPERDPSDLAVLNDAWTVAHGVFHLALVSACRSLTLLRIRDGLYSRTERYRRLSLPLRREDRDVNAEHKALVDAVLARREGEACYLISDHLWRTTDILLTSPVLHPGDGHRTGLAEPLPR